MASLVPALNTVTQTISFDTSGLYRIANQAVGDTLKIAKNGNSWGALKTADGGSKLAQLQSAGPLTATSPVSRRHQSSNYDDGRGPVLHRATAWRN